MISYEITVQEIINILMDPYNVSHEFLFWIRHKRYPVLEWTRDNLTLYVFQSHITTTYVSEWWIPIRLISKIASFKSELFSIRKEVLSSQKSVFSIFHSHIYDWIIIDNQQAGKYVPHNYFAYFMYFLVIEYLLLLSYKFLFIIVMYTKIPYVVLLK